MAMSQRNTMTERMAKALGEPLISVSSVQGGCIAQALRVRVQSGRTFFCKYSETDTPLFREEAHGLVALAATEQIQCPKVVFVDSHLLVLEWLERESPSSKFWFEFGTRLARLHGQSQDHFGFAIDNHIGATPQPNPKRSITEVSWADYFIKYRLQALAVCPQIAADLVFQEKLRALIPRFRDLLEEVREPASLVHGDLWGGNFICTVGQQPVLIDPAPYCGHREVDLAMTHLFGGFSPDFYAAYEGEYPLTSGYDLRFDIYNMYHLMNHWILFGDTYRRQCHRLVSELEVS